VIITFILCVVLLGTPLIVFFWYNHLLVKMTCRRKKPSHAAVALVRGVAGNVDVCRIEKRDIPISVLSSCTAFAAVTSSTDSSQIPIPPSPNEGASLLASPTQRVILLEYRCCQFVFSDEQNCFVKVLYAYPTEQADLLKHCDMPLAAEMVTALRVLYGGNVIKVKMKSIMRLIVGEVLHPFYIFQIFGMCVWCLENYYVYAVAIFFVSGFSLIVEVISTRQNQKKIKKMSETHAMVVVERKGAMMLLPSADLVPGDLLHFYEEDMAGKLEGQVPDNVVLERNETDTEQLVSTVTGKKSKKAIIPFGSEAAEDHSLPCDCVMLVGTAVVNEAMLTGESLPVAKTAVTAIGGGYSPEKSRRHTLYAGTLLMRRDVGSVAMVIRTGYQTTKGSLTRSILFPRPLSFAFYQQSLYFVLLLALVASVGFVVTLVLMKVLYDVPLFESLIRACDLITVVVPPALPAAMTIGSAAALSRLRKQQIFCISPSRINVSGKVSCCCFDKTGTLTEDGLSLKAIQGYSDSEGGRLEEDGHDFMQIDPVLAALLGCCHDLAVQVDKGGAVSGDPIEVAAFEAAGWRGASATRFLRAIPVEREEDELSLSTIEPDVEVIRHHVYPFEAALARMSVLATVMPGGGSWALMKGAPEVIADCLSHPVPSNWHESLDRHARAGNRVLAVCGRPLAPDELEHFPSRSVCEQQMTLFGLLIFTNALRKESIACIAELHAAGLRSIMVTGDNPLTAMAIAQECGITGNCEEGETQKEKQTMQMQMKMVARIEGDEKGQVTLWLEKQLPQDNGTCSFSFELSPLSTIWQPDFFDSHVLVVTGSGYDALLYHAEMDDITSAAAEDEEEEEEHTKTKTKKKMPMVVSDAKNEQGSIHLGLLSQKILLHAPIFARMAPEQKGQLMESLMRLQYHVSFCGDGANDCAALKSAHVGLSLAQTEASVAAPFTSRISSPHALNQLLKEGRCALVTSFACFKFMAMYSMIQFSSVSLLYLKDSNLADNQYLFIDLVELVPLAVTMGWTGAASILSRRRPAGSLLNPTFLISLWSSVALQFVFQCLGWGLLMIQPWYQPLHPNPDGDNIQNQENTVMFLITIFQYIAVMISFSVAKPFRKSLFSNYWCASILAILIAMCCYLVLVADRYTRWVFQMEELPLQFKLMLFAFVGLNSIATWVLEKSIGQSLLLKKVAKVLRLKRRPKKLYKRLLLEGL
jgi:cation-transporting P-type ATPase 13A2